MSDPSRAPLGADASPDQIEADIAETRARLADSVDALADKVNVKARAQEKVDEVRVIAQARVEEARAAALGRAADFRSTARAKAAKGQERAAQGSREVGRRLHGLPRPAQLGLAAAPLLLVVLLVARQVRS